jgi:hypothetical protein
VLGGRRVVADRAVSRPRVTAGGLCVIAALLTATAALTPSSGVRVILLCVGAIGRVVSSQALGAVRRQSPEGRGGAATGRVSAVWFALIAGVPFGLAWIVAHAGVTAGLWALSGLALLSSALLALVIAILLLSGGATIAGQNYGVLEAVRLGFAPQWLAPGCYWAFPRRRSPRGSPPGHRAPRCWSSSRLPLLGSSPALAQTPSPTAANCASTG